MRDERKKVWIDAFQTKLFLRMGSYWLIYQLCLWNLVFVWRLLHEGPGNILEQYGRFCMDYAPALAGCVLLLPVLCYDMVKFAHRIVGPIYRFRKAIQALAAGEDVRPVKLRDGDFLTEMQDEFNQLLEALPRPAGAASRSAGAADPERQTV